MTINYTILGASTVEQLAARVREYMLHGWQPVGGVTVDPPSASVAMTYYLQALVLENPK